MPSLVIVQPYLPKYRVPFFELLREALAETVKVRVIAGTPMGEQTDRGDQDRPSWLETVSPRLLSFGKRSVTLTSTSGMWNDAAGLIVPLIGSSIDSNFAVAKGALTSLRVGVWGHVGSYVAPGHPLDTFVERKQMKYSDHVFAYTPSGAKLAADAGVHESRITTVMNSVDTRQLQIAAERIDPEDSAEFLDTMNLKPGKLVSYVGGLDSSKRIDLLADALDHLWSHGSEVVLLVGGLGRQRALLEPAAARGQVRFLGYVDDAEKALMAAVSSSFVCPGRVGLLAVEAIALRMPVITTLGAAHGPEVEYLSPGESLIEAAPDGASLAGAILNVIDNPKTQIPRDVPDLERMVDNFSSGVLSMLNNN